MMKYIAIYYLFTLYIVMCEVSKPIVHFSPEASAEIRKTVKICSSNAEDVHEMLKVIREGEFREDKEFKSFIHCLYNKAGYSHEDGRVIVEKAASLFEQKETMLKMLSECDKDSENDPVETTFAAFKCFQENSPYNVAL